MKRIWGFFKNVIQEIRLTTWPDFRTTSRDTAIVLIGIFVFTILIASLDFVLFRIRNFILTK